MDESGRRPFTERFWAYVAKSDGCWRWMGSLDTPGYGRISRGGLRISAHRASYEMACGPIPAGLQIDHLCRNRACVNPGHLEAVTARENLLRGTGAPALSARKAHCKHGHELNETNTRSSGSGRLCVECRRTGDRARKRQKRAG